MRKSFGIVLVVLALLAVPAAADEYFYLVPQNSSCEEPGDEVIVLAMLHTDRSDIGSFGAHLTFDSSVVNVTNIQEGTTPDWDIWNWKHMGDYVFFAGNEFGGTGPGELELGYITLKSINNGVSPLEYGNWYPQPPDPTYVGDTLGNKLDFTAINGTFTCGSVQTFTKSLPAGWNLISLPLTPTDSGVSAVLSGVTQNAVKQYNATSKQFETATTMDPGTGYFVHVTSASTWSYQGSPESSTTAELKSGLNMIGVPNCTIDVGTAMGSTDYRYVARWNTTAQKFEVYNPNAPPAFHHFTTMEAGEGYFVSAKSDGTLTVTCP